MKFLRQFISVFVTATALSFGIGGAGVNAQPTALPPGGVNDLGAALFGTSLTGPWALMASMSVPFVTANFTGTLDTFVVKGDTTNPYGLANLDFIYRLSNSDVSSDPIHRLTIPGFAAFSTSVGYLDPTVPSPAPGGGFVGVDLLPSLADRSPSGTVGWGFLDPIVIPFPPFVIPKPGSLAPGPCCGLSNFTDYLVVYTNAPAWTDGIANVIDGSTANPATFVPSAVPEPGTYAMMLAGLGLMVFVARRRRGRDTVA